MPAPGGGVKSRVACLFSMGLAIIAKVTEKEICRSSNFVLKIYRPGQLVFFNQMIILCFAGFEKLVSTRLICRGQ